MDILVVVGGGGGRGWSDRRSNGKLLEVLRRKKLVPMRWVSQRLEKSKNIRVRLVSEGNTDNQRKIEEKKGNGKVRSVPSEEGKNK